METAVSLIIPIYNADTYLTACLDSVTAQTMFARMQVVLIDDGSVDSSPQICDVYAQKYPNIEAVHRKNAGVSAARNAGIELAVGKYIAFADADDLLLPQMLEQLYAAAEATGAQLSMCAFTSGSPDAQMPQTYPFPQNEAFGRDALVRYMLENENANALWNKLFLRAPIAENRLRMTVGRKLGEDREFILLFLSVCDAVCYVPQELYYYRYVETGAIRSPREGFAKSLTTQFASDEAQFALLGIRDEAFIQLCAVCFCTRIASSIDLLCRIYSGRERRRMLRRLYADTALQDILRRIFPAAKPALNRYTRVLLLCMRRRLVGATRIWMRLLTVRTNAYHKKHQGGCA